MSNGKQFEFGSKFQIDLIKLMIDSISFMLLCRQYVKPEYFSSERMEYFVKEIYKYHTKYKNLPDSVFLYSICKDDKDKKLAKQILKERIIKDSFIREKVKEFIQRSKFVDLYQQSGEIYNRGDLEKTFSLVQNGMTEINNINFDEDKFDFLIKGFDDRIIEREHRIALNKDFKIPTGIRKVDRCLGGGIQGGEVGFWIGETKAGKSFALVWCGVSAVRRFYPVLHVQLEGTRQQSLDRYDACMSGALYKNIKANTIDKESIKLMNKLARDRRKKDLIIRTFDDWDSCTVLDIEREYLELVERGYPIKLINIDYMDLMSPRTNFGHDGELRGQKQIVRDLKTLAKKYNIAIWTVAQVSRGRDIDPEDPNFIFTNKNIAEAFDKVRASDILITINVTTKEMHENKARLFVDTVRDNPSKILVPINRDLDRSRFYVKNI